jgi:hypothetical protein
MDGLSYEDFAKAVAGAINTAIRPLKSKIKALEENISRLVLHEARLHELENSQLKFAGTWREGRECYPGELLSFQGGLWHCNERTTDRPSTSKAFTLCVKRGRGE